jgi:hypothetical protein
MTSTPLRENGAPTAGSSCPDAELLAAYVDGRATLAERSEIEAHLARCEDCYFVFSETVRTQQAQRGESAKKSEILPWWRQRSPQLVAGLAAAATVVIVVQIYEFRTASIEHTQEVGQLTARVRDLEAQLAHEREQSVKRTGPIETPRPHLALPTTAIFALTPGMLRDSGTLTRVTIPQDVATIQFRLPVSGSPFSSYQVVFYDADLEEICSISKLRVDPREQTRALTVSIPSDLLSPGEYRIKLSGIALDHRSKEVATYNFRVAAR